ncbi:MULTISPECIES: type II toxin-antitoxin system RelE/ParE family toxin [Cupriavidus]|uniref:type II toxin-antitoxin system RelE/ParE family toxin n=1 Tax=Cupriavidus TaxID=106589 RepID=UPI0003650886|nr:MULTISPECIES: type II toxin-antitoxin system RelE/ParE family toxin [Cupriavidus]
MFEIRTTTTFDAWFAGLRDRQARIRIQVRIDRLEHGNPGDAKPVGGGISEMRIDHGPGYRVYFQQRGAVLVILLCGGDKATQQADIDKAHAIAARLDLE